MNTLGSEACVLRAPLSSHLLYPYPPSSFPLSSFCSPLNPLSYCFYSNPLHHMQQNKDTDREKWRRGGGEPTLSRRNRLGRNGKEVCWGWRGGYGESHGEKSNLRVVAVSEERVLICRLRGSLCRRHWLVCFISAPLVLWDGV